MWHAKARRRKEEKEQAVAAMENKLLAGLFEVLPEVGAVYPVAMREQWLNTVEQVFDLLYLRSTPVVNETALAVSEPSPPPSSPPVSTPPAEAEVQVVSARPLLKLGRPLEKNKGVKGPREGKSKKGLVPVSRPATLAAAEGGAPSKGGRTRGEIYDVVRTVLLAKGEPMTVREITLVIEKQYGALAASYNNLKQSLHAVVKNMEGTNDLESDVRDGLTVWSVVGG